MTVTEALVEAKDEVVKGELRTELELRINSLTRWTIGWNTILAGVIAVLR